MPDAHFGVDLQLLWSSSDVCQKSRCPKARKGAFVICRKCVINVEMNPGGCHEILANLPPHDCCRAEPVPGSADGRPWGAAVCAHVSCLRHPGTEREPLCWCCADS